MGRLRTWGRRFVLALQFLTRIPVRRNLNIRDGDLPGSAVFFPLIGLLVGAFGFLCALCAGFLTQSVWVMAAAAVLGQAIITGGLHLDGLADTCDGVFSLRSRERALEIMRDSRVGAMGVMGLAFAILIKVILVEEALSRGNSCAVWLIVLTPAAGRMGIVTAAAAGKPARADGSGKIFLEGVNTGHFLTALTLTLAMLLIGVGWGGLIILLAVVTLAGLVMWLLSRKLGGLTGDCLGAVNELCEAAALAAGLALSLKAYGFFG